MTKTLLALPCKKPGGLQAKLDSHFGHCEAYTLVTIENGTVAHVEELPAVPHDHGGCIAPVKYLAEKNVDAMIACGMGNRPLQAFEQAKIKVFYGGLFSTVEEAINGFIKGGLPVFSTENTCKGGCGGH